MLETLISSKTRIKLLVRLFLNPGSSAHLRGLAEEFDESTNSVRLELNRFEEAGMLYTENQGNKKLYKANERHPLFREIHNILLKYIGADKIIENMINRAGDLEKIYLAGDYAKGRDSGIIDLMFIGDIDKTFLADKVAKAESIIKKKIRYLIYDSTEWENITQHSENSRNRLLLWEKGSSTK
jgi:hypothetical protein